MIERLAYRLGFVRRHELNASKEKLREVRQQLEKANRAVAHAAAAVDELKRARHEDTQRHDARLAEAVAEHERRLARTAEELNTKASNQIAKLAEQARKREEQLEAALREGQVMEERAASATRELELAREYLMAIEVKLDILEGAANVLDGRLRSAHPPADRAPQWP